MEAEGKTLADLETEVIECPFVQIPLNVLDDRYMRVQTFFLCVQFFLCLCVYIHILYVNMFVLHRYVYIYIYIYIYIFIYTHTQVYTSESRD